MVSISETISMLQAGAHRPPFATGIAPDSTGLTALTAFGSNPGNLNSWQFVPDGSDLPLVIILHGCTQSAADYARQSGWSELAERCGFAILLPEQQRANNPNLCFNWFASGDTQRDQGEALSIRQMIGAMAARYPIDPSRVFVTGLSAGGAMASAMLATYPEVFAGGAIIAGLPYGAAHSMSEALQRMRGQGHVDAERYGAYVREASSHDGPWPSVSVWQGDADMVVSPANADLIVGQWRAVHGLEVSPDRVDTVDGVPHRVWLDREGREVIEDYRIARMGHGTPLRVAGERSCGVAGAHMLDVGISSTWHLAERWGLIDMAAAVEQSAAMGERAELSTGTSAQPLTNVHQISGVQATIENALRSAGLMR